MVIPSVPPLDRVISGGGGRALGDWYPPPSDAIVYVAESTNRRSEECPLPALSTDQFEALAAVLRAVRESLSQGLERGPKPRHLAIDAIQNLEQACVAESFNGSGKISMYTVRQFHEFAEAIRPAMAQIVADPDHVYLQGSQHAQELWRRWDPTFVPNTWTARALSRVLQSVEEFLTALDYRPPELPEQQPAPAQFGVRDGKIAIEPLSSSISPADRAGAESARAALAIQMRQLHEELKATNCDRRLVNSVARLQELLEADTNPFLIGLQNILVGDLGEASAKEGELLAVPAEMIRSNTRLVSLFALQFPEWAEFLDNSAANQLSDENVAQTAEAVTDVAKGLSDHPELADPKVPEAVDSVGEMIRNPTRSAKRIALGALRMIGNFAVAVARGVGKGLEKAAADEIVKLIVRVLERLWPLAAIEGLRWIEILRDIFKNLL